MITIRDLQAFSDRGPTRSRLPAGANFMTNWTKSLDLSMPSPSAKRGITKETAEACRHRASADLLKSVAMITANERLLLERSAERWTLRAILLERIEASARQTKMPSTTPTTKSIRL